MSELAPGEIFAGCRIDSVLGRGGMGVVYRAQQLDLGRPVALKVITADRAADAGFRERFARESRMAAAIDHPNVVPVHGAGEEDGELYIVMRYVRGSDLHALVRRAGRISGERAAAIVAQIASALDAAHSAGLVHRDVKPGNVLLAGDGPDEHAYLSDFGLTRPLDPDSSLTESGQWIGTVDFASPEQLHGERLDARSDVYSLGCVLFAALTGKPPFPRATIPATLLAHLNDPPPAASAAGGAREFDRVIARALAKSPDERYPSAGDLGRAALAAARGEAVTETERSVATGPAAPDPITEAPRGVGDEAATAVAVRPGPDRTRISPTPPRRSTKPRRRRLGDRIVAVGLALIALAAAGVGGFLLLSDDGGAGRPAATATVPLTAAEVRAAAQAFASAYEAEDAAALARVLTSDVQRVLPTGIVRRRPAVVGEYRRQFRVNATQSYRLEGLAAHGGVAGRASGTYRVTRADGSAIAGRIVLGVVRDHGRPRIALIAVTPSS